MMDWFSVSPSKSGHDEQMKANTKKALGEEEQLFPVFPGIRVKDRLEKNPELGTGKWKLSLFAVK